MSNPETDALREAIDNGAATEAEMTSLAAKLERERDDARLQVKLLRVENNHNWQANDLAEQAFRERDDAREDYLLELQEALRATRERDETRKQLRVAVGLLSTTPQFQDQHPEEVLRFVEEATK